MVTIFIETIPLELNESLNSQEQSGSFGQLLKRANGLIARGATLLCACIALWSI
jgi:hypothetical protein